MEDDSLDMGVLERRIEMAQVKLGRVDPGNPLRFAYTFESAAVTPREEFRSRYGEIREKEGLNYALRRYAEDMESVIDGKGR